MSIQLACHKHPKYRAVQQPRETRKYPLGCPGCQQLWKVVCNARIYGLAVRWNEWQ